MADQQLAPPITLTPPEPVANVAPESVTGMVPIKAEDAQKLDAQVAQFIGEVTSLDINSEPFKKRVDTINTMGASEMQAAAGVSNRMLERPLKAMQGGGPSAQVTQGLMQLRTTIEALDPSRQGNMFAPRKLLGVVPFGNKLKAYFDGYTSAQGHLNAIIEVLYRSKDELMRDNASIESEKTAMWALMQKLEQYIYLGKKIDAALAQRIASIEAVDPARAKVLKEDVLFYTRQRVQDLLTQMAVNVQGYLALDLIKKNNVELVKGVDRATTTTVSALRTAVTVAQALANQKLVLDQIGALNTTTGNLIESTSAMLRQQSATVYEQASGATVSVESLQKAFDNVFATIDMVSEYKVKALDSMAKTVDALSGQVQRSNTYLEKTRAKDTQAALTGLSVDQAAVVGTDGVVRLQ
jgi:uncharacterized protein YaaN involved in tellurite resistance